MPVLRAVTIAAMLLFACTAARAQTFRDVAEQLDAADRTGAQQVRSAPVRVQVTYQFQWPAGRTSAIEDQTSAVAGAHAALYGLAAHECELLRSISTGTCRMLALNVSNMVQPFNSAATIQVSASATFELAAPAAGSVAEPKP